MSKYDALWAWIKKQKDGFKLTFVEIEQIAGFPIGHSFLTYKKELMNYGYQVGKISMKEQTVMFQKLVNSDFQGNNKSLYTGEKNGKQEFGIMQ